MRRFAAPSLFLGIALAVFLPSPRVLGKLGPVTVDKWARESALVIAGKAASIDGTRVRFEVVQVLKGTFAGHELVAAPLLIQSCMGPPDQAPFPVGTEVVLFLQPIAKDTYPVLGGGSAWMQLAATRRAEVLGAVAKVVEIEALPSPEARMKSYLDVVERGNPTLRGIARQVISLELCGKDKAAPWEDRLVALIRSPALEARTAAIQALQFSKSEKALPALLEAIRDENRTVRESACMALSKYDTGVTVQAILEAAKRPDMVPRVIIDLRGSRNSQAREALVGFLHSEDPVIRRYAAGSFYDAIFKGDPVILEIHRLVDDSDVEVREVALQALHKSPMLETVAVLTGALRRNDIGPREVRAAVSSLGVISGEVTNRKELRGAFQDVRDLPSLMEKALRSNMKDVNPPLGGSVVMILGATASPEAKALLLRIQEGEFGQDLVVSARKTLEWLSKK